MAFTSLLSLVSILIATAVGQSGGNVTAPPPTSLPPVAVVLVTAVLRLEAPTVDFSSFVQGGPQFEATAMALTADLASILGVDISYIRINSITDGSLLVDYTVIVPPEQVEVMTPNTLRALQQRVGQAAREVTVPELDSFDRVFMTTTGQSATSTLTASTTVTEDPIPFTNPPAEEPSDEGFSRGYIAAIVIGAVAALAIIILFVFAVVRSRQDTRVHGIVPMAQDKKPSVLAPASAV